MKDRRPGGVPFAPVAIAGELRGKMPVASKNCLGVAGLEVIQDHALVGDVSHTDADFSPKEDIAWSSFFLRDGVPVFSRG